MATDAVIVTYLSLACVCGHCSVGRWGLCLITDLPDPYVGGMCGVAWGRLKDPGASALSAGLWHRAVAVSSLCLSLESGFFQTHSLTFLTWDHMSIGGMDRPFSLSLSRSLWIILISAFAFSHILQELGCASSCFSHHNWWR